jgi:flagellar hook-basal body complex protein FliE
VGSVLTNALTSQSSGLAAIANRQALARVTQQLKAAATSALGPSFTSQLNATSSSLSSTQSKASTGSSLNLLA